MTACISHRLLEPGPRHKQALVSPINLSCKLDLVLVCFIHPPLLCSSVSRVLGTLELPPRTLVLTEDHCSHEETRHHPQEPEESLRRASRGGEQVSGFARRISAPSISPAAEKRACPSLGHGFCRRVARWGHVAGSGRQQGDASRATRGKQPAWESREVPSLGRRMEMLPLTVPS